MSAFFYGTLQSPTVLLRVICGPEAKPEVTETKLRSLKLRPATLKGHRRYALKNLDYPGVVKSELSECSVSGILCEGLSRQDILRLDAFEGDEYDRVTVSVSTVATNDHPEIENEVPTQLYLWTAGHHHLEERDWDFEQFIKDKQAAWMADRCEFNDVDKVELELELQV
ncbi:hypothetical protein NQZ79_g1472 [Umbelopsis isabellina]|nr:hypothetical protein NQZ79_g1472 [Umbelopsis isabellina]